MKPIVKYLLLLIFLFCHISTQGRNPLRKKKGLALKPLIGHLKGLHPVCGICGSDPSEIGLDYDPSIDFDSDPNEIDFDYTHFTNTYLKSKKVLCRYAPIKVIDGKPSTAWVEGESGQGIGAELIVPRPLKVNKPVQIWAGYGKSKKLFYANSRPKKIEVSVIRTKNKWDGELNDATGCSNHGYHKLKVVGKHTVTLKNLNTYQKLALPRFKKEKYKDFPDEYYLTIGKPNRFPKQWQNHTYFLKIKILEVYPGNRYKDTVISEIKN